jgi:hypothetical protein
MGWSSWTSLRCDPGPTEASIQAQAMLHQKLQAHGYQLVNVDSCWQQDNTVDPFGRPGADPAQFPSGTPPGTYSPDLDRISITSLR